MSRRGTILVAVLLSLVAGCASGELLNLFTGGAMNSDQYRMMQINKGGSFAIPADNGP